MQGKNCVIGIVPFLPAVIDPFEVKCEQREQYEHHFGIVVLEAFVYSLLSFLFAFFLFKILADGLPGDKTIPFTFGQGFLGIEVFIFIVVFLQFILPGTGDAIGGIGVAYGVAFSSEDGCFFCFFLFFVGKGEIAEEKDEGGKDVELNRVHVPDPFAGGIFLGQESGSEQEVLECG